MRSKVLLPIVLAFILSILANPLPNEDEPEEEVGSDVFNELNQKLSEKVSDILGTANQAKEAPSGTGNSAADRGDDDNDDDSEKYEEKIVTKETINRNKRALDSGYSSRARRDIYDDTDADLDDDEDADEIEEIITEEEIIERKRRDTNKDGKYNVTAKNNIRKRRDFMDDDDYDDDDSNGDYMEEIVTEESEIINRRKRQGENGQNDTKGNLLQQIKSFLRGKRYAEDDGDDDDDDDFDDIVLKRTKRWRLGDETRNSERFLRKPNAILAKLYNDSIFCAGNGPCERENTRKPRDIEDDEDGDVEDDDEDDDDNDFKAMVRSLRKRSIDADNDDEDDEEEDDEDDDDDDISARESAIIDSILHSLNRRSIEEPYLEDDDEDEDDVDPGTTTHRRPSFAANPYYNPTNQPIPTMRPALVVDEPADLRILETNPSQANSIIPTPVTVYKPLGGQPLTNANSGIHFKPLGGQPTGPIAVREALENEYSPYFAPNPKEDIKWDEPRMFSNCWAQAMLSSQYGFSPSCTPEGAFSSKQCYLQRCWCVSPDGSSVEKVQADRFAYAIGGILLNCDSI